MDFVPKPQSSTNDETILDLLLEEQQSAQIGGSESSGEENSFNPEDFDSENEVPETLITEADTEDPSAVISVSCPLCLSFSAYSFYCLGICLAIIVVFATLGDPVECDTDLVMWGNVEVGLLVGGFLIRIWACFNARYRGSRPENNIGLCFRMQEKWVFFLLRISNMMWGIWLLIGMIWTFNSHSCRNTAPALYALSLTVVSITLSLICLFLLCTLCGTILVGLLYLLSPNYAGIEGASKVMIDQLETQTYTPGQFEDPQDAKCAICLCVYEEGEELRYLPCTPKKHHFHRDCVDEWLQQNKTCPFCKRPIDAQGEASKDENNDSGEDSTDINVTIEEPVIQEVNLSD